MLNINIFPSSLSSVADDGGVAAGSGGAPAGRVAAAEQAGCAGGSISGRVGDTGKACDAGRVGGVGGGNARAAPVAEQARGRGSGWHSHRSRADTWRR